MNENLFNAILEYGDRYRKEYIFEKYTKEQLLEDWREALMFFFKRACYQGRLDTVSDRVYQAVEEILMPKLPIDGDLNSVDLEQLEEELKTRIGPDENEKESDKNKKGKRKKKSGRVGKPGDRKMVICTLKYVGRLPQSNIVTHSLEIIKAGHVDKLYDELRHENGNGIFQVGTKVASFYIRDLVTLFDLESQIEQWQQYCLQPIDTWVRKLAKKIIDLDQKDTSEGPPKEPSEQQFRKAIIRICNERSCSSLQFNQGAWYAGSHAFDLLLGNLAKYGI